MDSLATAIRRELYTGGSLRGLDTGEPEVSPPGPGASTAEWRDWITQEAQCLGVQLMAGSNGKPSKGECLAPGCRKPAQTRGLCVSCYSTATHAVRDGRTTWAYLIAEGVALPPTERQTPLHAWLAGQG